MLFIISLLAIEFYKGPNIVCLLYSIVVKPSLQRLFSQQSTLWFDDESKEQKKSKWRQILVCFWSVMFTNVKLLVKGDHTIVHV